MTSIVIPRRTQLLWWQHWQLITCAVPTGSCGGSKHVQHAPAHTLILNDWMGPSRRWACLVGCLCYQLMARLDGRTIAPSWNISIFGYFSHKMNSHLCIYKVLHGPVCMYVSFYPSSYFCLIQIVLLIASNINYSYVSSEYYADLFSQNEYALYPCIRILTVIFIYFKICVL